MSYYQARLSIETARLLERMRVFYENEVGGTVTKGDCLIKAYNDSLWVTNWKDFFNVSVPSISDSKYEVSPTGQLLKVQITDEVREGIQEFKKRLPQIIGTRSVTVGVCIREILKAAYFKNVDDSRELVLSEQIKEIIRQEKEEAHINISENICEEVFILLDNVEKKILDVIRKEK